MKALVLAAGLGTRLRPYTEHTPKPLFTLDGRPLLARMIDQLIAAGAQTVVVNTHHLAAQIQAYLADATFAAEIVVRHEPEILGTGGAIRNTADIWGSEPFMVVNSDIATDIDLGAVYRYHRSHPHPVTLVCCHDPAFNTVAVDDDGFVVAFVATPPGPPDGCRQLTFTGIQVIDPAAIDFIPPRGFAHSIEAFKDMMTAGHQIKAFCAADNTWSDLGSPERYRAAAREMMAAAVFDDLSPAAAPRPIRWDLLAGDGSDRCWYRLIRDDISVVMVDHGIRTGTGPGEADAFVSIGRHLHRQGSPVPRILRGDPFAGLVFVEDLGDRHLQTHVAALSSPSAVQSLYRRIIDLLVQVSVAGGTGFDPDWTWQTRRYDREVIVEKECRYFMEAFVRHYCSQAIAFERIEAESHRLADAILAHPAAGFMHRDFQSRNILISDGKPWIIDFQGGRLGPVQYDLASLLIDPYVALPAEIQTALLEYFVARHHDRTGQSPQDSAALYRLCALARNLQILGAFGFLAKQKGKTYFANYIPNALESLRMNLAAIKTHAFPELQAIAETLARQFASGFSPPGSHREHRQPDPRRKNIQPEENSHERPEGNG
jgi:aminoglycoside/choline kinase family phosphotransferase/dTDP-glucose pyrophosphorylase